MKRRSLFHSALFAGLAVLAGSASAIVCPGAYHPMNNQCVAAPHCPAGYFYPGSGSTCKSTSPSNHRSYAPSCPSNTVLRGTTCLAVRNGVVQYGAGYPPQCTSGGFLSSGVCTVVFSMTASAQCPSPGSMAGFTTCVAPKLR